ncbi:MAG: PD-(D/E)XK nuclease family protein [Actinomycetota bacterium]
MSKAREFISPSDLTFSWNGCHRCLWLNYNHGVKAPSFMPLVGELSAMQENHVNGAISSQLHPDIKEGRVLDRGGWVKSIPIPYNGKSSPYAIRGKYDLLMEFEDGTYGIIDCKFQGKDNDKSDFYAPQLEAYAYALENPVSGEPRKVSVIGLLVWSPKKPLGDPYDGFSLGLNSSWFPITRNPEGLQERLQDFIEVISGPTPVRDSGCETCKFISNRREIFGAE